MHTLTTHHRSNEVAGSRTVRLGRYRLIARLGKGGMGDVFLAILRGQRGFNKLVVLKIPRDEVTNDPSLLAMFLDEARIAARLHHPNVVQTFEVVHEVERDVIVMEYLEGQTLNEITFRARRAGRRLPLWMHLHILSEALNGLHYAHDVKDFDGSPLELVHRDASPHNIFVTFDGETKMLDFGIAKARTSSHNTATGTFKGKVRYMPFEQLANRSIDRRTDVFAIGVSLWEAITGQKLWAGKSDVDVMTAIIGGDIPADPKSIALLPDTPPSLVAICLKALAHQPRHRYASCADLAADLEHVLATLPERRDRRSIGTFVQELFSEERERRRSLLERKLSSTPDLLSPDEDCADEADIGLVSSSSAPTGLTPPPLASEATIITPIPKAAPIEPTMTNTSATLRNGMMLSPNSVSPLRLHFAAAALGFALCLALTLVFYIFESTTRPSSIAPGSVSASPSPSPSPSSAAPPQTSPSPFIESPPPQPQPAETLPPPPPPPSAPSPSPNPTRTFPSPKITALKVAPVPPALSASSASSATIDKPLPMPTSKKPTRPLDTANPWERSEVR